MRLFKRVRKACEWVMRAEEEKIDIDIPFVRVSVTRLNRRRSFQDRSMAVSRAKFFSYLLFLAPDHPPPPNPSLLSFPAIDKNLISSIEHSSLSLLLLSPSSPICCTRRTLSLWISRRQERSTQKIERLFFSEFLQSLVFLNRSIILIN